MNPEATQEFQQLSEAYRAIMTYGNCCLIDYLLVYFESASIFAISAIVFCYCFILRIGAVFAELFIYYLIIDSVHVLLIHHSKFCVSVQVH